MNEQSLEMAGDELINALTWLMAYAGQVCDLWRYDTVIEEHFTTEQLEAITRQAVSLKQGLKELVSTAQAARAE